MREGTSINNPITNQGFPYLLLPDTLEYSTFHSVLQLDIFYHQIRDISCKK